MKAEIRARLEKSCEAVPNTGCWLWTGATNEKGYGKLYLHGKMVRAHRVSYQEYNGPIPEGMLVLHKCDTPSCINPLHLKVGTLSENAKDAIKAGVTNVPHPQGSKHPKSKFTPEQVANIRKDPRSNPQIAKDYGVVQSTIWEIKTHRSYPCEVSE